MAGFELLKLEDFADFVEKSDVDAGGAVVSVAADANRTLLAPSCVEPSAIVAGSTSNASPGHNFSVIFSRPEITTKATPYVFSDLLQKLFVNMDKPCPVQFNVAVPDEPSHYNICSRIVYARPEHQSEGIQRCPNHQDPERSGRPVVDPRTVHVLRCDHREAIYETADASQQRVHNQVVLPLSALVLKPAKSDLVQVSVCFFFMCRSSCRGINRRPTKLVFRLVNKTNGMEVARQEVAVRICSCPGRDVKNEEDRLRKKTHLEPQSNDEDQRYGEPRDRSTHDLDTEEEDVFHDMSQEQRRHIFSWQQHMLNKTISILSSRPHCDSTAAGSPSARLHYQRFVDTYLVLVAPPPAPPHPAPPRPSVEARAREWMG